MTRWLTEWESQRCSSWSTVCWPSSSLRQPPERLCHSHPFLSPPAVLETLATCLPAHQVQDTGGNPSTFLSADWRVNARSVPQTCRFPGRPGCRHASDFPEKWLPLATWGLRKPRCLLCEALPPGTGWLTAGLGVSCCAQLRVVMATWPRRPGPFSLRGAAVLQRRPLPLPPAQLPCWVSFSPDLRFHEGRNPCLSLSPLHHGSRNAASRGSALGTR